MDKRVVLCDVDGVLLDWTSRLPYFLKQKGLPIEKAIFLHARDEYFSLAEIADVSEEEGAALNKEYSHSKFMRYLQPYRDACLWVNLLKQKYDFVAVTAIGTEENVLEMRRENLEFWFPGAFSEVIGVNYGETKLNALVKYDPTVFIDDSPKYIKEGLLAGHTCIRMIRDSRACQDPSLTARNWAEVSNLLQIYV